MTHLGFIILLLIYGNPIDQSVDIETHHLAQHMIKTSPQTSFHAYHLADSILTEAASRGLDPALLAAIAWTESGFRKGIKGSAGEVGIWQIIPGYWLARAWDEIRDTPLQIYPPWTHLSKNARRALCRNVRIGTYIAAWILDYHMETCGDHAARCYARYQTGRPFTTSRYVAHLKERSEIIRLVLRGEY